MQADSAESLSFRSLTILNYVVHNVNDFPPAVAYHVFKEKNVLNLFVSLLERQPWRRRVRNPATK